MVANITLRISQEAASEQTLRFSKRRISFGRDPDSDIEFDGDANASVSWNHAEICLDPHPHLIDCDSTNGTSLNGQRIESAQPLKEGDNILLGSGPSLSVLRIGAETPLRSAQPTEEPPSAKSATSRSTSLVLVVAGAVIVMIAGLVMTVAMQKEDDDALNSSSESLPSVLPDVPGSAQPGIPTVPSVPLASKSKLTVEQPKAVMSVEEITEKFKPRMVWMGITAKSGSPNQDSSNGQLSFSWCSGWLHSTSTVVLEGERGKDLKDFSEKGDVDVFMVAPSVSEQRYRVEGFKFNSRFDPSNHVASSSLINSVCKVTTPGFKLKTGKLDAIAELGASLINARIYVLLFSQIEDGEPRVLDRISTPSLQTFPARVSGTKIFPGAADDLPLLKLQFENPTGSARMDGGLAVTVSGDVVGVVMQHNSETLVIPYNTIEENR